MAEQHGQDNVKQWQLQSPPAGILSYPSLVPHSVNSGPFATPVFTAPVQGASQLAVNGQHLFVGAVGADSAGTPTSHVQVWSITPSPNVTCNWLRNVGVFQGSTVTALAVGKGQVMARLSREEKESKFQRGLIVTTVLAIARDSGRIDVMNADDLQDGPVATMSGNDGSVSCLAVSGGLLCCATAAGAKNVIIVRKLEDLVRLYVIDTNAMCLASNGGNLFVTSVEPEDEGEEGERPKKKKKILDVQHHLHEWRVDAPTNPPAAVLQCTHTFARGAQGDDSPHHPSRAVAPSLGERSLIVTDDGHVFFHAKDGSIVRFNSNPASPATDAFHLARNAGLYAGQPVAAMMEADHSLAVVTSAGTAGLTFVVDANTNATVSIMEYVDLAPDGWQGACAIVVCAGLLCTVTGFTLRIFGPLGG